MIWNRLPFFGMTDRNPSSPLIFLGLATQLVQYGGLLEPNRGICVLDASSPSHILVLDSVYIAIYSQIKNASYLIIIWQPSTMSTYIWQAKSVVSRTTPPFAPFEFLGISLPSQVCHWILWSCPCLCSLGSIIFNHGDDVRPPAFLLLFMSCQGWGSKA